MSANSGKNEASRHLPSGAAPVGGQNNLDVRLFIALRTRGHWRPLQAALIVLTQLGNWGLFWIMLAVGFWLAGAGDRGVVVAMTTASVYLTLFLNFAIKLVLRRRRPASSDPDLRPLVRPPASMSFPSSHAAMSFAAAGVFTSFFPFLFPLFYGLALLMSLTRVYVGVHYPSDILGGAIVGLAAGGAAMLILNL